MSIKIINMDVLDGLATLPDESVQCVVTSPPYWALRDYQTPGQIGLEATPDEYILKMLGVFRGIHRVLRKDGTVWVNMGDGYNSIPGGHYPGGSFDRPCRENQRIKGMPRASGLKPKDLIGMPWRLALALQADGWWLRSDIIWHKPNPMPESCTDRPTKSHEYIFLLTKASKYYYDAEAIREPLTYPDRTYSPDASNHKTAKLKEQGNRSTAGLHDGRTQYGNPESGRNKRTVWTMPTAPYPGAHYATFPPALPEICIKAGTSERGCCPECGSPWERVVEATGKDKEALEKGTWQSGGLEKGSGGNKPSEFCGISKETITIGWQPTCECWPDPKPTGYDPIPCTVLDPFNGHGTTGLVAARLGRSYIGIEINQADCEASKKRIENDNPMFNSVIIEPQRLKDTKKKNSAPSCLSGER